MDMKDTKKHVVFKLNSEEYAVHISKINEISKYQKTNWIPDMPQYVEGVINLRGKIIPVLNLKKRFNLDNFESVDEKVNRIIIANKKVDSKEKVFGIIVDSATEVIDIEPDNINTSNEILNGQFEDYISGVAKVNDRLICVLDIAKI